MGKANKIVLEKYKQEIKRKWKIYIMQDFEIIKSQICSKIEIYKNGDKITKSKFLACLIFDQMQEFINNNNLVFVNFRKMAKFSKIIGNCRNFQEENYEAPQNKNRILENSVCKAKNALQKNFHFRLGSE